MNDSEALSGFICDDQTNTAERELSAFIGAVTQLYGPEQAALSAQDWLEELELMNSAPRATRNWRFVTIAASARLAIRVNAALHRRMPLAASIAC